MCFKQLAGNTGLKNDTKIAICASSHNFVGLYFHNWGMYRQLEKIVKQQYLCHMSTQYGELRSTNSLDRFGCLETPANFIGFRVLPLLLQSRRSPEANQTVRCLVVSWDGTLYIHFRGSCPLAEFCPVQNSFYVQVLRSPILAALLHGSPAEGVSPEFKRIQMLWPDPTRKITERDPTRPANFKFFSTRPDPQAYLVDFKVIDSDCKFSTHYYFT